MENKGLLNKRRMSIDELNRKEVPSETKKAMRAAHLFGSLLKTHFEESICELMDVKSFDHQKYVSNILDNLLLIGGTPRDILLNTPIKNIDITFNLRELTKIQLNHLQKYHQTQQQQSRDVKCAYFQHYLNKFEAENNEEIENEKEKNIQIKFHNSSYIFNARYFVDVFCNHYLLDNADIEIQDVPDFGFISLKVKEKIFYEGYSLKDIHYQIMDTFNSEKTILIQHAEMEQSQKTKNNKENKNKYERKMDDDDDDDDDIDDDNKGNKKHSRWKSISLQPMQYNINYAAEFDEYTKEIHIDIYETRLKDKIKCFDFSINTAIIPLKSVVNYYADHDDDDNRDENIIKWFWESIIENGLDDINALEDITINRVLRVPQKGRDKYIIDVHPECYHFWRLIELMIRLPSFTIDKNLINAHIENYKLWLNNQYFNDVANRNNFIQRFKKIGTSYCKSMNDLRTMLTVLHTLEFNQRFILLLNENKILKKQFVATLKSIKSVPNVVNTQILHTFGSYGYDYDEQHELSDINRLKDENEYLKQKIIKLQDDITDLEKGKLALIVSTSKAIDQFRSYFVPK